MNLVFNITSVTVDALPQAVFPSIYTIFEKFNYDEILRKLRTELAKNRPGKLHRGILFHHDNAPAHSAGVTKNFLREFRWELLPHQPYSPDLAPSDFFLFPKLKEHLKGVHFNSTDEAKHAVKNMAHKSDCRIFQKWHKWMETPPGEVHRPEVMLKNKFIVNRNQ